MLTIIILYLVIAALSSFTALVITKLYNWKDDDAKWMYSIAMGLAWPIGIPVTMVALVVTSMDSWADLAANRIRQRNK